MSARRRQARPWGVLAAYLAGHAIAVQLVPSPWLAPNLTVAGIVASVAAAPPQWMWLAGIAGLLSMVWAASHAWAVAALYLAVGGLVRLAADHWDLSDPRVRAVLIACGAGLVTTGWLALLPARSWAVLAWAGVHLLLTSGMGWLGARGTGDA